jgi:hypothetical protein
MSDDTTLAQSTSPTESTSENIWQRVADFIVKAEFSRPQPVENKNIQYLFADKAQQIDHRINEIRSEIRDFKAIMTRAGATQWRNETEHLVTASQKEAQGLQQSYRELKTVIVEQCEHLNRASMNTVKTVAQLVSSVKHTNIKKLNEEKTEDLKLVCENQLQHVDILVRSFHWKNLVLVVLLSILVSIIVSLYIDDGWPWQVHSQVAKERQAGKILMNSWTQLSQNDQLAIENA